MLSFYSAANSEKSSKKSTQLCLKIRYFSPTATIFQSIFYREKWSGSTGLKTRAPHRSRGVDGTSTAPPNSSPMHVCCCCYTCMGVQSWPHSGLARHEESVQLWARWIAVVCFSTPRVSSCKVCSAAHKYWEKVRKCAIVSASSGMLFTEPVTDQLGMSGGRRPPMEDRSLKQQPPNGPTDFRVPSATSNWLRTTYQIDNNASGTSKYFVHFLKIWRDNPVLIYLVVLWRNFMYCRNQKCVTIFHPWPLFA